jgi:tRNA(Ile)-lysidine synthase
MSPGLVIKTLAEQIADSELFDKNASIVVAVSGGPDSMALLHALAALNKDADYTLALHVAHLNHQLRGLEAEKDAAFVHAAADSLSIGCTTTMRDVAAIAGTRGASIEEVARDERYRFLERVALDVGAQHVAVGHHADDNAETILHRILRGTGVRGLAGIPKRRSISPMSSVEIIRPLLEYTRVDLLRFLEDGGIPHREDRTNRSNEPTRNLIRNVILPQLESEINPQVKDALLRLGEQARWVEEYLRETAQRTLDTLIISRNDQQLVLNAASLARKNRIIQTELVRRCVALFDIGQQDLSFAHIKAVIDLVADPASGKQVSLPGGMSVTKLYDRLIFSLPTDQPRESIAPEVSVHVPGITHLPVRRLEIECQLRPTTPTEIDRWRRGQHHNEEWADFDQVHPPLVVRARQPGDRFWPLGAPGSKKISEFLIDAKVDPIERDRVAVICDQLGPLWVVGHRLDERAKLTRRTKNVLHMRIRPLEPDSDR